MDNRQIEQIADILYTESNAKSVTFLKQLQTEDELFVLLDNFNWNNGFEVPKAVLAHSKCSLSVALLAFYRADGIRYLFEGEAAFANSLSMEWKGFVKNVYTKNLRGQFPSGAISFQPEITKVQKFKLKKLKPEIDERFLEGISGKDLNVVI